MFYSSSKFLGLLTSSIVPLEFEINAILMYFVFVFSYLKWTVYRVHGIDGKTKMSKMESLVQLLWFPSVYSDFPAFTAKTP